VKREGEKGLLEEKGGPFCGGAREPGTAKPKGAHSPQRTAREIQCPNHPRGGVSGGEGIDQKGKVTVLNSVGEHGRFGKRCSDGRVETP